MLGNGTDNSRDITALTGSEYLRLIEKLGNTAYATTLN